MMPVDPVRLEPFAAGACPIRERTGDGKSVGRCWFGLQESAGRKWCPRHGDVTKAVEHYLASDGKLFDELSHVRRFDGTPFTERA